MAELTFKINGADYPTGEIRSFINSFTIDECGIFHRWTGVLIEDIEDATVNSQLIAAFMQIAYMRGNPGVTAQAAREAIGASNFADALADFNAAQEDEQVPLARTPSGPEQNGSPGNEPESKPSSGDGSMTSSVTPLPVQRHSGSPRWEPSVTSGSTK